MTPLLHHAMGHDRQSCRALYDFSFQTFPFLWVRDDDWIYVISF
jgi:hypothetical protein